MYSQFHKARYFGVPGTDDKKSVGKKNVKKGNSRNTKIPTVLAMLAVGIIISITMTCYIYINTYSLA